MLHLSKDEIRNLNSKYEAPASDLTKIDNDGFERSYSVTPIANQYTTRFNQLKSWCNATDFSFRTTENQVFLMCTLKGNRHEESWNCYGRELIYAIESFKSLEIREVL